MSIIALALLAATPLALPNPPPAPLPGHDPATVMAQLKNPRGRAIVVAHRGCHNPAPEHGLSDAPENSLIGLDHCVTIGADVMETDVRITRDGYLVMIHDATVDRTTDGIGKVADLTLAQIGALRLRANEGGAAAPLTEARVPTLDAILRHAKGRLVLNLDIKDAIYPEAIDAVVRAGAENRVIVKTVAGIGSAALAAMPPYDRVPFMPILSSAAEAAIDLPGVIAQQVRGRTRPIGFEVPRMPAAALPAMAKAARATRTRLWSNTLWEGFIAGYGGDADALKDPAATWGQLRRDGVSIFQTDEPAALLRYLDVKIP